MNKKILYFIIVCLVALLGWREYTRNEQRARLVEHYEQILDEASDDYHDDMQEEYQRGFNACLAQF